MTYECPLCGSQISWDDHDNPPVCGGGFVENGMEADHAEWAPMIPVGR